MKRRQAILLFTAALASRASASVTPGRHEYERLLMGTRFIITCYGEDRERCTMAADAAFAVAGRINEVASDYIADSELLGISKHPVGQPVVLSPLLFNLVSEARDFAEKTGGNFDPTFGPLTRLWRETRRRQVLPDAETLAQARASTGWKNLVLDPKRSTATFMKPGMRLDLGGIAKGQAADAMLAIMRDHGVSCACVTAGGDVRAGEAPPGQNGWKVAIHNGKKTSVENFRVIANAAISTSGDVHQFIEIGGVRYSHIIDPATGLGLTRNVAVTIVASSATTSDAIATACCVASPETAREMGRSAGASEVILA